MARRWTAAQLEEAVSKARSIREIIYSLGLSPSGGNYAQVKKISELNLSIPNFKGQGWNKGLHGIGKPRRTLESILVSSSSFQSYKLKNRLMSSGLKPRHCEECGWARFSDDGRLPLELDHINGDSRDNRLSNL